MRIFQVICLAVLLMLFAAGPAPASLKEFKVYKNAFPDAQKPSCMTCHVDKAPKKDARDLNAYGEKIKETMAGAEVATEEMLQSIGAKEDFDGE